LLRFARNDEILRVQALIDNLSILLTHGLIALALWRLLNRADLDAEVSEREAWQRAQENTRDA
jgi:hypothetical protein